MTQILSNTNNTELVEKLYFCTALKKNHFISLFYKKNTLNKILTAKVQ